MTKLFPHGAYVLTHHAILFEFTRHTTLGERHTVERLGNPRGTFAACQVVLNRRAELQEQLIVIPPSERSASVWRSGVT